METQQIILDFDRRQESIQEQTRALVDDINGVIPEDKGLLAEVTNLIEAPTAFLGTFEEKYLELPRDVLVTVMRKHQRYFAVEDTGGNLMNYFIGVRNGDSEHLDKVVHGNEHVIRARFSDADFFYQEDIKKPLKDYLPRLGTLTFQTDLGSMLEKNERVSETVEGLGDLLGISPTDVSIAQRAAPISKADLATNIVVEMTSLQGIMGREYAIKEGYTEDVANTIFEHWLPRSAGDRLPESNAGTLLAIADKLDSLVGLFAVGLAPKSTSDPYGLRRTALGIVQILVDKNITVDLRQAIDLISHRQPVEVGFGVKHQIIDFVKGRLDAWLDEEYDYARDVINAVLSVQAKNPARAVTGIKELSQWVARDDWEFILDNFSRCVRITRDEEQQTINPDLLSEPQEKALYAAYQSADEKLTDDANVGGFLSAFEPMVPVIAEFFDNVLVHADDPAVRDNRIALLQLISHMQNGHADLSQLDNF